MIFKKHSDKKALSVVVISLISVLPLLFMAKEGLRGTTSIWDPWAYHKLHGYFDMLRNWLWS